MRKRYKGQVIVLAAIFLPVLLLLAALGVDGLLMYRDHAELKSWAYRAAVAGASEVQSHGADYVLTSEAPRVARDTIDTLLAGKSGCQSWVWTQGTREVAVRASCPTETLLMESLASAFGNTLTLRKLDVTVVVDARVLY